MSVSEVCVTVVAREGLSENDVAAAIAPIGSVVSIAKVPNAQALNCIVTLPAPATPHEIAQKLRPMLADKPWDFAVQPHPKPAYKLFVADMDSTMISIECIDELAAVAGIEDKVADITERAMRGELDFEGALIERVALLKGLPLTAVDEVFDTVLEYNSGAEELIANLNSAGVYTLLVSGGFTLFTKRVSKHLGFKENRANTLNHNGETLTGTVGMPILGKEAKLHSLQSVTAQLGIAPAQTIAIGDGANDGLMIAAAGLGIAYKAKDVLKSQACGFIEYTDLRSVRKFLLTAD